MTEHHDLRIPGRLVAAQQNPAVHLGEVFEDLAVRKPSELAGDVVNRKIMSVALRHDPAPHLAAPAVANRRPRPLARTRKAKEGLRCQQLLTGSPRRMSYTGRQFATLRDQPAGRPASRMARVVTSRDSSAMDDAGSRAVG
jgi:hypothetical protein